MLSWVAPVCGLVASKDSMYGVVALGDSVYPQTFCFGGKKFDELLAALGAQRVGERAQHDAHGAQYPEDVAASWVRVWYTQLEAEEAKA